MYWQARFDRADKDEDIKRELVALREQHPNYGYRRLHACLKKMGYLINIKRVQRLIQQLQLQVKNFTRRSRKYYSYRGEVGKLANNLINRHFHTSVAGQKITTDTSEFKYYDVDKSGNVQVKKLYLNPFLDMYNGEIVSYSISSRPTMDAILAPLEKAIEATNYCPYRRTFHSDQGWAYQMKTYRYQLRENGIYQSMSRKGNCLDNSPMENFFGLLKQEIYYGNTFHSYDELATTIEKYIRYYNEVRIKAKLGYLSPVEYRLCHAA